MFSMNKKIFCSVCCFIALIQCYKLVSVSVPAASPSQCTEARMVTPLLIIMVLVLAPAQAQITDII